MTKEEREQLEKTRRERGRPFDMDQYKEEPEQRPSHKDATRVLSYSFEAFGRMVEIKISKLKK